jgi:hypothetical protein
MTVGDRLNKIGAYLVRRAKEPTTWTGLALLGTLIGGPGVGVLVGKIGTIAGLVTGGALVTYSERPHTDA